MLLSFSFLVVSLYFRQLLLVAKMDLYATNPGPIDDSVLYDQDKHVSSAVWEGQVPFASGHILFFCLISLSTFTWKIVENNLFGILTGARCTKMP